MKQLIRNIHYLKEVKQNPIIAELRSMYQRNQSLCRIFLISSAMLLSMGVIETLLSEQTTLLDIDDYYSMDSLPENAEFQIVT